MQLPKSRRRQKLREKKCQYPGCGKIFFGIHISKYCPEHRQDRYRIRKRTKPEDVNIKNQTFKHNYSEVIIMVLNCALEGCDNQFEVKIYPRQYIYPKFCPEHRNEYKRIRHLRQIGREDLIEQLMKESETMEIEPPGGREKEGNEGEADVMEDVA
jgi:hypothetical protein